MIKGQHKAKNPLTTTSSTTPSKYSSSSSSSSTTTPFHHVEFCRSSVIQQVNWFGELQEKQVLHDYFQFTSSRMGMEFISFVTIVFMGIILPFSMCLLIGDLHQSHEEEVFEWRLLSSVIMLFFNVLIMMVGVRFMLAQRYPKKYSMSENLHFHLHHAFCIILVAYLIITFLRNALSECDALHEALTFHGGHSSSASEAMKLSFSSNQAVIMLVVPYFLTSNLPQTRLEVIWSLYSVIVLAFLAVVLRTGNYENIPLFVTWLLGCIFVCYDHHIRSIAVFLTTSKLKELLAENERLADEMHANEMRSMIANVAHDLKTVSSLF